jgi:hypothetical protein
MATRRRTGTYATSSSRAGAQFAEMEMREVLRAAADLTIRPVRPDPERARRSMLVVTPHRGGEVLVG